MLKQRALDAFGGVVKASEAIGVTPQAVSAWPEHLGSRISDRVIAALVRTGRHDEARALATGRDDAPAEQESAP